MAIGPVTWPIANATAAALLGPGVVVDSVSLNSLWVVIVGGILAFAMVWWEHAVSVVLSLSLGGALRLCFVDFLGVGLGSYFGS